MVEKVRDLPEKMDKDADVGTASIKLLFDDITNSSAGEICEWILNANFSSQPPSILNLLINSPGGELYHAFAIIDIMRSSHIPIRTVGLGQIQSAGLMIFLAGTKGERFLTPSTCIMSHQYFSGAAGKHHELVASQKDVKLTHDRILGHYKRCTGLSEAKIKKYLLPAEDVFLTAEEALQYGICDKITLAM